MTLAVIRKFKRCIDQSNLYIFVNLQDRAVVEGKLHKEIITLNETNMNLENKVDDLDRKTRTQQEQIYELKEQLAHNQADLKLKTAHFDGRHNCLLGSNAFACRCKFLH